MLVGQTLTPAQAASLLFRPAADYNGSTGIVFTVTDNGGLVSAPATFGLVVSAVNDAPNAADDTFATIEDTPVTLAVLANDSDVDGDALTIVAVAGQPIAVGSPVTLPQGSVALNADGTLTFTPNPDFNGTVAFGYSVSDGTTTSTAAVSVAVAPAPDAAVIGGVSTGATVEDSVTVASGALTIVDPDAGEAAFVAQTGVVGAHGSFSIDPAGAWTYTLNNADPAVQALGQGQTLPVESFTVRSIDGTTQVVTVTITGTNDAAVLGVGIGTVSEDGTLSTGGTLAIIDVDSGEAAFVAQPATAGSVGSLSLAANGTWTYTLDNTNPAVQALGAGQTLTETFAVASLDGTLSSITITVNGTNDAAVIGGSAIGSVTEDGLLVTGGALTVTDVDAGQASFVAQPASAGAYGSFTLGADGSWSYALNNALPTVQALGAGQTLTETFTVATADGTTSSVVVTIHGTDDAPVISTGTGAVTENTLPSASGTLTATDVDNPALAFVAATIPGALGALTLGADGAWSYTLDARAESLAQGQTVNDVITVALDDGSTTTVTIVVTGTNDAPVAQAAAVTVAEGAAALNGAVSATDIDAGAVLVFSLNGPAPAGLTFNPNGSYAFDPSNPAYAALAVGQSQVLTVPYTVTDEHGASSTANLVITVTGTNNAPVAQAAAFTVAEGDAVVSGNVLATDVDAGAVLTYALDVPAPAGLTFDPNGSYSFDADVSAYNSLAVGQSVVLTLPYTVTDDQGATSTANLVITVTGTNDSPVAQAVLLSVFEDAPLVTGNAVASDPDAGAVLTFALVGPAPAGLVLNADGSYTFNPADPAYQSLAAGAVRVINVPYLVTDEHGAGSFAGFVIVVRGTNDGPVAQASGFSVAEDAAVVSGAVVATDVDTGAVLSFALNGAAPAGLTFNSNGSYSFDPSGPAYQSLGVGQSQVITVPYTVTDDQGATSTANLVVTVTGTNDAPVAQAASFAVTEDAAVVLGNVAATDVDANAALAFALNGAAPAGLSFNADGSYSFDAANAAYQSLAAGQVLVLTVPYTVTDDQGATSSANLVITVTGVNDAAVVTGIAAGSVTEDATLLATGNLSATDVDGPATFTAAAVSGTYGNFAIDTAGAWTYTLRNGDANVQALTSSQHPTETFTVTTADGTQQQITVTVNGANEAPVAIVTPASGAEDAAGIPVTLTGSDVDGSIAGFTVTTLPANGTLLFGGVAVTVGATIPATAGSATLSFVPAPNWNGSTTITFTATDAEGATSPAVSQSISVAAVNDAPLAADDTASTPINTPLASIAVLANDSDVDGDALSVVSAVLADPTLGSVSINPDGTLAFSPALNVTGAVRIDYTVSDPSGATSTATLTVNVGNNTPPAGTDATLTLAEDGSRSFSAADFGFADADAGQTLAAVRIDSLPAAGSLTFNGNPVSLGQLVPAASLGNLVFTPAPNANGNAYASFGFSVQDNAGGFDTTPNTITLNVTPVNDAPQAANDAFTTNEDQPLAITLASLLGNDTDIDGDTLVVISAQNAQHGTLGIVAGNLVFTPDADYNGPASFTYTVSDGNGGTSTATVNITVVAVDDPSVLVADTATVAEDSGPATGNVLANDSDVDDTLSVAAFQIAGVAGSFTAGQTATIAGVGTLSLAADGSYSFAPLANWNGAVPQVTYTTNTGSSATLDITVTPVNDAPQAANDSFTTDEDQPLTITPASLLANDTDIDGDSLIVLSTQGATHGTLGIVAGNLVFTPDADYNGPASFTYTISDGNGGTSTATVNINVTPVNDAAVIGGDDLGAVTEDLNVVAGRIGDSGTLTISDVDAGEATFVAGAGTPVGATLGALSIDASGNWTYDVANADVQYLGAGQTRVESFTVRSVDGTTHTVVVTITGTNDGPVAVGSSFTVAEDAAVVNGVVTATDVDAGATLSYALTGAAPAGLTFNSQRHLQLQPGNAAYQSLGVGQTQVITVPFRATDDQGASSVANLVITVTGTNDGPVAVADSGSLLENAVLSTTAATGVLANDTDVDAGTPRQSPRSRSVRPPAPSVPL